MCAFLKGLAFAGGTEGEDIQSPCEWGAGGCLMNIAPNGFFFGKVEASSLRLQVKKKLRRCELIIQGRNGISRCGEIPMGEEPALLCALPSHLRA